MTIEPIAVALARLDAERRFHSEKIRALSDDRDEDRKMIHSIKTTVDGWKTGLRILYVIIMLCTASLLTAAGYIFKTSTEATAAISRIEEHLNIQKGSK